MDAVDRLYRCRYETFEELYSTYELASKCDGYLGKHIIKCSSYFWTNPYIFGQMSQAHSPKMLSSYQHNLNLGQSHSVLLE